MTLKTFNIEEAIYAKFSHFCKEHGISMSKQVEMFMRSFMSEEPKATSEYLKKLGRIRKGKFVEVNNFAERYKL